MTLIASTPCPSCGQYTLSVDTQERLACTLQPAYNVLGCPNPLLAHEILDRRAENVRSTRESDAKRKRAERRALRQPPPDEARTL